MTRARTKNKAPKQVADYRHDGATRPNNPPAGLAWQDTEETPMRRFSFDPHLSPELWWAGKAESDEHDVEAPSIHVHERLSTEAILRVARREPAELTLFADPELDRSKAVEFYKHEMGWANRMILGDSLRVMASLLERERLGGQVQLVYLDPPYGINFNSNFQRRVSNRSPKETSDETITREPEQVQAYRDTWELGIHSYLTYLRDRLKAAHELLADEGSVVVQIGPDRVHLVRVLLDEIFGAENAGPVITVVKTSQVTSKMLPEVCDFLLWYAKDVNKAKFFHLFAEREGAAEGAYRHIELPDGTRTPMTAEHRSKLGELIANGARVLQYGDATSQGYSATKTVPLMYEGREFHPGANRHWLLRTEGMEKLAETGRLAVVGNTLRYIRYADDFPFHRRTNVWTDTGVAGFAQWKKQYVVETNPKIVERCIAMLTEPGDLVVDPTCGSGTTAWACEKMGRRWITVDTSRVALSIARQRLLTAKYDYFQLAHPEQGVDGGFRYRSVSRVTASSLGYEQPEPPVALYDQPLVDSTKVRVSGPFTFEALSRYSVNPRNLDAHGAVGIAEEAKPASGINEASEITDHVTTLLSALESHGIPREGGSPLRIKTVQRVVGSGALHAEGFYVDDQEEEHRFGVSIGPRFGPLTVAQIDEALHQSYGYDLVVFVGFAVHSEAQAYVASGKVGRFRVALLEANADLLLGDLLKKTTSSQTFKSFASPDWELRKDEDGHYVVEVKGMDAFDTATGEVVSRDRSEISAWFLDHNYDRTVFHVEQAFFTRNEAWKHLERALKDTVDQDAVSELHGYTSLPFAAGESRQAAIRVIDDHGTTSEAIIALDGPDE